MVRWFCSSPRVRNGLTAALRYAPILLKKSVDWWATGQWMGRENGSSDAAFPLTRAFAAVQ